MVGPLLGSFGAGVSASAKARTEAVPVPPGAPPGSVTGGGASGSGEIRYPRGPGASEGSVPSGYVKVSRWVAPAEVKLWMENQGTTVPRGVGTPTLLPGRVKAVSVTQFGAPRPGGTGPVRIDFFVPQRILEPGGKPEWFRFGQTVENVPIYNVEIHLPPPAPPRVQQIGQLQQ